MAQLTIDQLKRFGIRPDTSLGQHFLVDDNILRVIGDLSDLQPADVCYEPGIGVGVLTDFLARACSHVHGVEIDRRLQPAIDAMCADLDNVTVHWGDACDLNPQQLTPRPNKLVSNLPYHVSAPIVAETLQHAPCVRHFCVMVQKETGQRLFSPEGSREYGAVSALLGATCRKTGQHKVSRAVFAPPPNVDSMLIAFARREAGDILLADDRVPDFSAFLKTSFRQRRKTLSNNLAPVAPRDAVVAQLDTLGLAPATRPEQVSPAQFVQLFAALGGDD